MPILIQHASFGFSSVPPSIPPCPLLSRRLKVILAFHSLLLLLSALLSTVATVHNSQPFPFPSRGKGGDIRGGANDSWLRKEEEEGCRALGYPQSTLPPSYLPFLLHSIHASPCGSCMLIFPSFTPFFKCFTSSHTLPCSLSPPPSHPPLYLCITNSNIKLW